MFFFFLQADIFSSKFVYFPVCTEGHWCLLVSVLKSLNYLPLIIGVFSDFYFYISGYFFVCTHSITLFLYFHKKGLSVWVLPSQVADMASGKLLYFDSLAKPAMTRVRRVISTLR